MRAVVHFPSPDELWTDEALAAFKDTQVTLFGDPVGTVVEAHRSRGGYNLTIEVSKETYEYVRVIGLLVQGDSDAV